MLKGCQKKIIFLKDTECEFFEGAYFVIKPEYDNIESSNIVNEATKIANGIYKEKSPKKKKRDFLLPLLFSLGMLVGTAITICCYFMFI